jgi:hypothetical protein
MLDQQESAERSGKMDFSTVRPRSTVTSRFAKAMKRTEAAVRQKAKTIGVGLGHRR